MNVASKYTYVTIFLLLSAISVMVSQNDSLLKMFRSVQLLNNRQINLISSIEQLKDITTKSSNINYKLNRGVYSGADSMSVEVNNMNQIIAITAYYDTTYAYEKTNYNKWLGMGKDYHYISPKYSIKTTKWENQLTIFELVEFITKSKTITYSVIFDKSYYISIIKQHKNISINDNSIEILRKKEKL